jgi:hypothetical protein
MTVKMTVFWDVLPHSLADFADVSEECTASILYHEDGSSMFI